MSGRSKHDPNGIGKFYMGREIAHVMGHAAASWLERPEREEEENPKKLIELLNLKDGDVVADIGAGSGYYSFRMSKLVGTQGEDPGRGHSEGDARHHPQPGQEGWRDQRRAGPGRGGRPETEGRVRRRDPTGGRLPRVRLSLRDDRKDGEAIKPGGRLVFVEFRLEDEKVPIKLIHKMTERQVIKEMAEFKEMKHTEHIGQAAVAARDHVHEAGGEEVTGWFR